jgi:hypothetical protein
MDMVWITIAILFFGLCLTYVGFLDKEGTQWKT